MNTLYPREPALLTPVKAMLRWGRELLSEAVRVYLATMAEYGAR